MSYWNRPFFPEYCSDATLDDSATYDTMVRIAGSWVGIAQSFKVVVDYYRWTHIVLLTDDTTTNTCWYGGKPFDEIFGADNQYTYSWIKDDSDPTDEELDYTLQLVRSLTRGCSLHPQINVHMNII